MTVTLKSFAAETILLFYSFSISSCLTMILMSSLSKLIKKCDINLNLYNNV